MQRDIIANIIISQKTIRLVVLEKLLSNKIVEIFNGQDKIENDFIFLNSSLDKVKKIIGGDIKNIYFTLDSYEDIKDKVVHGSEWLNLSSGRVSQYDVNQIIELAKINNNNSLSDEVVVNVQPFLFTLESDMDITKRYDVAPIGKKGQKLFIDFSITTISKKAYHDLIKISKTHSLEIKNIFMGYQTLSYSHISKPARRNLSSLLNISDDAIFWTIVKNDSVLICKKILDFGKNYILKQISDKYNISSEVLWKALIANANFINNSDLVINMNEHGIKEMVTTEKLVFELKEIFLKVFNVYKLSIGNHLNGVDEKFPIILSGNFVEMSGFGKWTKEILVHENTYIYQPLTFIEGNKNNLETLGIIEFMERSNEILGIKYDTLIETNRNTMESLIGTQLSQKGIMKRVKNWIGDKYGWQ